MGYDYCTVTDEDSYACVVFWNYGDKNECKGNGFLLCDDRQKANPRYYIITCKHIIKNIDSTVRVSIRVWYDNTITFKPFNVEKAMIRVSSEYDIAIVDITVLMNELAELWTYDDRWRPGFRFIPFEGLVKKSEWQDWLTFGLVSDFSIVGYDFGGCDTATKLPAIVNKCKLEGIGSINPSTFFIKAALTPGFSGSPITIDGAGSRFIAGIVTSCVYGTQVFGHPVTIGLFIDTVVSTIDKEFLS